MHNLANISPNLHDFPFSENILHTEIYAKFRQKSIHIEDESVILFLFFFFIFLFLSFSSFFRATCWNGNLEKQIAWPKNEQRKNCEIRGIFCWKIAKMLDEFCCWAFEVWAVQKYVNLVDLVKSFPTSVHSQKSASIQPNEPLKIPDYMWANWHASHVGKTNLHAFGRLSCVYSA